MEQSNANSSAGKGLMVTGLILGILNIIMYFVMAFIVAGILLTGGNPMMTTYIWIVVALIAPVLSFMGMKKAGAVGGKKGMGVAGLICGLIGLLLAVWLCIQSHKAMAEVGDVWEGVKNGLDSLKNAIDTSIH